MVVERRGGVSVFAHRRCWGAHPSRWGSGVAAEADLRQTGWRGYRPMQCPYCCAPTPPQHRGVQPGILSLLSEDEGQVYGGGAGWSQGGLGWKTRRQDSTEALVAETRHQSAGENHFE